MDVLGIAAIIASVYISISLWAFYNLLKKIKGLDAQLNLEKRTKLDIEQRLIELEEAIHEVRTGAIGMGAKLKEVSTDISSVRLKQEELQQLDPEMRLYSRAAKLVSSGASVQEIMEECELPRGEAEMLISLHKNHTK